MNWVDIVIILILIFFTLEGLGRSFIGELLDFFSFLLAFFFSLRFYNEFGLFYKNFFSIPHSLANVLGFVSVWFIVETILFTLVHILLSRFKPLHKLNVKLNVLAVIPAFFRGLIFIAIILVLIGTFPIQPRIKKAVSDSQIGSRILAQSAKLERPLKNVFGGITQDTLTFLTIKPRSDETVNLGFQTTEFNPSPQLEIQMVTMVNRERVSTGLKSLEFDDRLRVVGRNHSADMFTRGYFAHYSPEGDSVAQRAEKAGIGYLVIGENLAYAPDLDLAHNGLMNSPGHRANILSEDFGKIGIGIQNGGVYGLMITQVFSN
ncbi:CvpA family protein [Candidatus Daviesbacteria bacterium]|nr:CvpA family protein [Candidatus Daviesbacteria bacterium]